MIDTRILKYKGNRFNPLTDLNSVIDEHDVPLKEVLITSEETDKLVEGIEQNLIANALRKTEQVLTEDDKKTVEKNLGIDIKFRNIFEKLSKTTDVIFDATELYNASQENRKIDSDFKKQLMETLNNSTILLTKVKLNSNNIVNAVMFFVNKTNNETYFIAQGRDYRYNVTLDNVTDMVKIERFPISAPFNRYVNDNGNDIFHIETTASNSEIQQMLTTDKGEVLIPSVGDVFEVYEETPQLGRILHYSGIVTSRVEVNSDQDIILISNDLKDDFFMMHHIKLTYIKSEGVTSLVLQKAYHMIINPYDLEINNRNVIFYNDTGNSIFNVNNEASNAQIKGMLKNKYQELMIPHVGDMFISLQEANGKELTESGIVISDYDTPGGFCLKIISNNFEFEYWTLHSINFSYDAKQGFDSLRVTEFYHTVIDPSLIEHVKLQALYDDVERIKNNTNMANLILDNINGENGGGVI